MALKVRIGPIRHTLEFGYKGDDNLLYAEISDHEVGSVIDKSDIPSFNKISIDRIIDICIPETVECIEPGTFADFVNLTEVVILGDVFGVEWKEGQWTAPLSPSTLVDEVKRGRGKIIIHRK